MSSVHDTLPPSHHHGGDEHNGNPIDASANNAPMPGGMQPRLGGGGMGMGPPGALGGGMPPPPGQPGGHQQQQQHQQYMDEQQRSFMINQQAQQAAAAQQQQQQQQARSMQYAAARSVYNPQHAAMNQQQLLFAQQAAAGGLPPQFMGMGAAAQAGAGGDIFSRGAGGMGGQAAFAAAAAGYGTAGMPAHAYPPAHAAGMQGMMGMHHQPPQFGLGDTFGSPHRGGGAGGYADPHVLAAHHAVVGGGTSKSSKEDKKQASNMPIRSLSAYNFFFRDERTRILNDDKDDVHDEIDEGDPETLEKKKKALLDAHLNKDRTKRRPHRKTHGKIGFTSLSKLIGKRWRELPENKKQFYREIAAMDMDRYQREVAEYNKGRLFQETTSVSTAAATPATAVAGGPIAAAEAPGTPLQVHPSSHQEQQDQHYGGEPQQEQQHHDASHASPEGRDVSEL